MVTLHQLIRSLHFGKSLLKHYRSNDWLEHYSVVKDRVHLYHDSRCSLDLRMLNPGCAIRLERGEILVLQGRLKIEEEPTLWEGAWQTIARPQMASAVAKTRRTVLFELTR
jgi:hypothetical protein